MIRCNLKYKLCVVCSALAIKVLFAGQFQQEEWNATQTVIHEPDSLHFEVVSGQCDRSKCLGIEMKPPFRPRYFGLEEILGVENAPIPISGKVKQTLPHVTSNESLSLVELQTNTPVLNFNRGFFDEESAGTPVFYLNGGQSVLPFGKFQSMMITPPLTQKLGRTESMPLIVGYNFESGFSGEIYTFRSNIGAKTNMAGLHASYAIKTGGIEANIGASYIGSIADSKSMQDTGEAPGPTFGGFGSEHHGSQDIKTVPAVSFHGNVQLNRYRFTLEWLMVPKAFEASDLSFKGRGAKPKAAQFEAGFDFETFAKPASLFFGYQWSDETIALNFPHHRFCTIFNISLWENTVESLEFRHDIEFSANYFGNGRAPADKINQIQVGKGRALDAVVAQIKINF